MAATGDGAVNIGPRSRGAGGVAGAVGSGITGNDCVFQSHAGGAHADAAASTFGHEAWRLVRSALVDTAVAALRVVKAQRSVLDIDSGCIVGNGAAIRETAGAMIAATTADLSAVAPITSNGEVVRKSGRIDDHGSAVCEHSAAAGGAAVTAVLTAKAAIADGIAAGSAGGSCQVERGVAHRNITEAIQAAAISFTCGFGSVATRA